MGLLRETTLRFIIMNLNPNKTPWSDPKKVQERQSFLRKIQTILAIQKELYLLVIKIKMCLSKDERKIWQKAVLFPDNAPVHKNCFAVIAFNNVDFDILNHPPYPPGLMILISERFFICSHKLKEFWSNTFTSDDEEVKDSASAFFNQIFIFFMKV